MDSKIENIVDKYLGMMPNDVNCNSWMLMRLNMIEEIKQLKLCGVVKSLPTKEDAVAEGYRIAKDAGYNYRRVLKELDHDIYYSGWMDCHDWITK